MACCLFGAKPFSEVIWALGNIFQWNSNYNMAIFIEENYVDNDIYKMSAILSGLLLIVTY